MISLNETLSNLSMKVANTPESINKGILEAYNKQFLNKSNLDILFNNALPTLIILEYLDLFSKKNTIAHICKIFRIGLLFVLAICDFVNLWLKIGILTPLFTISIVQFAYSIDYKWLESRIKKIEG